MKSIMSALSFRIIRRQLDRKLESVKSLSDLGRPTNGWIQAIREGLGMPAHALAKRMGITQASVSDMEKRELEGRVTLNQSEKAARAMNCRVVYSLVPECSLEEILRGAAEKKAIELLSSVGHSMALENQALNSEVMRDQKEDLVDDMMNRHPKRVWE